MWQRCVSEYRERRFHSHAGVTDNGKLSYLSLSTPPGEESVRDLRFRRIATH